LFLGEGKNIFQKVDLGDEMVEEVEMFILKLMKIITHFLITDIKNF
jgi:hypothetical protein